MVGLPVSGLRAELGARAHAGLLTWGRTGLESASRPMGRGGRSSETDHTIVRLKPGTGSAEFSWPRLFGLTPLAEWNRVTAQSPNNSKRHQRARDPPWPGALSTAPSLTTQPASQPLSHRLRRQQPRPLTSTQKRFHSSLSPPGWVKPLGFNLDSHRSQSTPTVLTVRLQLSHAAA